MSTLALTTDLVLVSQLAGAAQRAGTTVHSVGTPAALMAQAEQTPPKFVLVDLSQSGLDIAGLVAQIKAAAPAARIVAFGPHVHRGRLAAAREAGCDVVLSRGAFHAEMDALVARAAR